MIDPGRLTHSASIQTPGVPAADGDGGYAHTWTEISPSPVWCSFTSAASRDLQRLAGGNATLSAATHIIEMHYHSGILANMRVVVGTRAFNILGIQDVDEANQMTRLFCEEVLAQVPAAAQTSWIQQVWFSHAAPVSEEPSWIQEGLST